jgi:hypothetical protein
MRHPAPCHNRVDGAVEQAGFCKLWLHLTRGDAHAFGFFPRNFVEARGEGSVALPLLHHRSSASPQIC